MVPCCVFPKLFKARRRLNGDGVVRYACAPGWRKSAADVAAMASVAKAPSAIAKISERYNSVGQGLCWPSYSALNVYLALKGAMLASLKPYP